jgi:hypothetical protein
MSADRLTRIYIYLTGFFPENYRQEYAEELAYTFRTVLEDAAASGGAREMWAVAWRELRDFPLALLKVHVCERNRTMKLVPGAYLPGDPVIRWRLAAVLLPFILFALYSMLIDRSGARLTAQTWNLLGVLSLVMYLGILFLGVYGVVRGLPTWSLPAWSIPFFMVNLLSIQSAYGLFSLPATQTERILVMMARSLISYTGMLVLGLAMLFLVRPFYRRVRQDWTLLAFLFFCGFLLLARIADPYIGLDIFEGSALVLMGLGALVFLLAPKKWQRFTALAASLVLAFALLSRGIYLIYPQQVFARDEAGRLWETLQPLLMLPGMIFTLALTPLLSRVPGFFLHEQQPAGSQP